jgi:hypothetical protein
VGVVAVAVYIWCGFGGVFYFSVFFIFLYIKTGKGKSSLLCKAVLFTGGQFAYTVSWSYLTCKRKVILDAKKKTQSAKAEKVF